MFFQAVRQIFHSINEREEPMPDEQSV